MNGDELGICGFEDWAVLSAMLSAVRDESDGALDGVQFYIGGLERGSEENAPHSIRLIDRTLMVGDQIEIEIIDASAVIKPINRTRYDRDVQESPFTEEEIEEMERKDYETLKAKFEPNSED